MFAAPKYNKYQIKFMYENIIREAKEGTIPEFTMYNDEELKNFSSRIPFNEVSWSIATPEVAKQISENAKDMDIHGIYSGSGLWEKLVSCYHNNSVIATDIKGNNVEQLRFRNIIESKASDSIDMIDDVPNTCLFMGCYTYQCEDVTKICY